MHPGLRASHRGLVPGHICTYTGKHQGLHCVDSSQQHNELHGMQTTLEVCRVFAVTVSMPVIRSRPWVTRPPMHTRIDVNKY